MIHPEQRDSTQEYPLVYVRSSLEHPSDTQDIKVVIEDPDSRWLTKIHTTSHTLTDNKKTTGKLKHHVQDFPLLLITKHLSEEVASSQMAKSQMAKRLCLVDDLKMLKITMSNTSSRKKLYPEINDHYNIFTRESQEYELKTNDKA
ncbi:hypothetical protein Tco_0216716 [Tanacetum coccineum]